MFLLYRLFLTTAHLLLMLSPLARVRICLQRMIKERLCGSPYSMQRWFGCVCLLLTAVTAPLIYYKPDSSIHYKTRVKPSACCAVFFPDTIAACQIVQYVPNETLCKAAFTLWDFAIWHKFTKSWKIHLVLYGKIFEHCTVGTWLKILTDFQKFITKALLGY